MGKCFSSALKTNTKKEFIMRQFFAAAVFFSVVFLAGCGKAKNEKSELEIAEEKLEHLKKANKAIAQALEEKEVLKLKKQKQVEAAEEERKKAEVRRIQDERQQVIDRDKYLLAQEQALELQKKKLEDKKEAEKRPKIVAQEQLQKLLRELNDIDVHIVSLQTAWFAVNRKIASDHSEKNVWLLGDKMSAEEKDKEKAKGIARSELQRKRSELAEEISVLQAERVLKFLELDRHVSAMRHMK